jgi:hypothetical protein
MSTRSVERIEFLSDIVITAVEGGIGYWSTVERYAFVLDEYSADNHTSATILETGDGDISVQHEVTIETIARGLARVREDHHKFGNRSTWVAADRENDAGEFDSCDADALVQLGLFGEVRYG